MDMERRPVPLVVEGSLENTEGTAGVVDSGGLGIDISQVFPKPLADEVVQAADVVITMGCGDVCPLCPGKRYEDWQLDDPAGRPLDEVRLIRDELDKRIEALLAEPVPPDDSAAER